MFNKCHGPVHPMNDRCMSTVGLYSDVKYKPTKCIMSTGLPERGLLSSITKGCYTFLNPQSHVFVLTKYYVFILVNDPRTIV